MSYPTARRTRPHARPHRPCNVPPMSLLSRFPRPHRPPTWRKFRPQPPHPGTRKFRPHPTSTTEPRDGRTDGRRAERRESRVTESESEEMRCDAVVTFLDGDPPRSFLSERPDRGEPDREVRGRALAPYVRATLYGHKHSRKAPRDDPCGAPGQGLARALRPRPRRHTTHDTHVPDTCHTIRGDQHGRIKCP